MMKYHQNQKNITQSTNCNLLFSGNTIILFRFLLHSHYHSFKSIILDPNEIVSIDERMNEHFMKNYIIILKKKLVILIQ